jgi:type II secretory pathway component GspD/PulD (secretin)
MFYDFQPSHIDGILNPSIATIPVAIRPEPTSAPGTSLTAPNLQSGPVPIFRSRQFANSAMVRDGQTLVLGGFTLTNVISREPVVNGVNGLPLAGRLFRSVASSPNNRNLLIFVTPRLVDLNGKPLHTDQELQVTSPNRR